jgi:hypothetical protein
MNHELEGLQKEAFMAKFKASSQQLFGGTKEMYKTIYSGYG